MEHRSVRQHGLAHVNNVRQWLVLNHNGRQGRFGLLYAGGSDGRHCVTVIQHFATSQDIAGQIAVIGRPGGRLLQLFIGGCEVVTRHCRHDPRHCQSRGQID